MSNRAHKESTLRFYKQCMLRVLVFIQERLDEPLALDELAAYACLSPHHFHRVFRGMLGEPLMAHVRRLRLERAAYHLKVTRRPVVDLAFEAGYDSHEAFTRAFKAVFGFAPTEYRRRRAAPDLLPARSGIHYRNDRRPLDFRALNSGLRAMNVTIEHLAPMRVAFVRHIGPYNQCGSAWDRLCTWLGKEGWMQPGCRFLGVSYDDPDITPAEKIRYDACATVPEDFAPEGEIGMQILSGGDYARTTHVGPYERFNETYGRLMGQWLPRSGRRLRNAPCLEFYLNDPGSTAPADLLTDVCVPLEPR
jgi:AraC family transcriptional regulator